MKLKHLLYVAGGLLAIFVIATLARSAEARDPSLKMIWGGGDPEYSTYSGAYVPRIIEVLDGKRLAGYKWAGPSEGSVFNMRMINEHPTNLAVGQLDVLKRYAEQYPVKILHEDVGPECLYMVTSRNGYENLGHVLGNAWDLTIATGKEGSGSWDTYAFLGTIYPELVEEAEIKHVGGSGAVLDALESDVAGVGFFIIRPDPHSATFRRIADNEWTLIPVVGFEIEDFYSYKSLKVENVGLVGGLFGDAAKYHTTACTSVALFTGDPAALPVEAEPKVRKRLEATIERVGAIPAKELRPNLEGWRDMFDSLVEAGQDTVRQLSEATKQTVQDLAH